MNNFKQKLMFFVCIIAIMFNSAVVKDVYAGGSTEELKTEYGQLENLILEKSGKIVNENLDSIISIVKSSCEELNIDSEELIGLSKQDPFVIYSLDDTNNSGVFYYPIGNKYGRIVFTVQVSGKENSQNYDISTDYVEMLNNIDYVNNKYLFYESKETIYADNGCEIMDVNTGTTTNSVVDFFALNYREKVNKIQERINNKVNYEETSNSGLATYTPSFMNTGSNVKACALHKRQSQGNYGLCWAASVATIVNYRKGKNITAKNVADMMGIGYNTGGTVENAVVALNSYHVSYKVHYSQNSWSLYKRNIDTKYPVYAHCSSKSGYHAVVGFGYKIQNDTKYVFFWNPGSASVAIVKYKAKGTTFSYNNTTWTWKLSVSKNG